MDFTVAADCRGSTCLSESVQSAQSVFHQEYGGERIHFIGDNFIGDN